MKRGNGRRVRSKGKGKLSLKRLLFGKSGAATKRNSRTANRRVPGRHPPFHKASGGQGSGETGKTKPGSRGNLGGLASRIHVAKRPAVERSSPAYLCVVCLVVILVAAAFVFHLHVRFEGVRLGYQTSQARVQRARLLVERRELRLELASLKAPKHVESEARKKLHMEIPDYRRLVSIGAKKKAVLASGRAR